MFGKRIRLFTLFGFTVSIDVTWFFLFALVAWSLGAGLFPAWYGELSGTTHAAMGLAGALGLFVSVVWHELCHSLVARRFGIPMEGITLFLFGGVAEMHDDPPSPTAEFLMAVAGPISSVVLAAIAFGASHGAGLLGAPASVTGVLVWLAIINVVLAVFNLAPGFPLDGGRALRAALWSYKGDLRWATRIASNIGGGFGLLLMVLGFVNLVGGNLLGGLWWILIGMFVRQASNQGYRQLVVRELLEGEPVRRFMTRDPVTVAPSTTLAHFVEDYLYRTHHKLYAVVEDGRVTGRIHIRDVKPYPRDGWEDHTVGEAAHDLDDATTIAPDADATAALARMRRGETGRLIVVEDGQAVGMLTLRDLMTFLSMKMELDDGVETAPEALEPELRQAASDASG